MAFLKRVQFVIACCILFESVQSKADELTVIYPVVKAPYDQIFNQIRDGISAEFNGDINEIRLPGQFLAAQVVDEIKTQKVIALGKGGWIVAKQIYQHQPVVVGALPIKPNGISGVSLVASPGSLFEPLQDLAPQVKTITVVYTPASIWNIRDAVNDAAKLGYELKSIQVNNIQQAVQAYENLFEGNNLSNQAIWLPLDPVTANDKVIVPAILEKAWAKKMVVFSSKPTHAQRGALFSAVPDNKQLGQQLIRLLDKVSNQPESIVTPLDTIKLAVNLRTAAHLGFNYSKHLKAEFALTFPD